MPWFRNFIQLAKQSPPQRKPAWPTQLLRRFSTDTESNHPGLRPTKGDEKPRVVVLGTGWAGCRLMKDIDTNIYDVVCISPRNHMVFTPLLASTCVGTLEFRSVAEPIGRIQPAISREPGSYFFLSNCMGVDFQNRQVFPPLHALRLRILGLLFLLICVCDFLFTLRGGLEELGFFGVPFQI